MLKKEEVLNFSEGMNGHFLPVGILLTVASLICFLFFIPLAVVGLVCSFALFTSISGVEIDIKQKRVKTYKTLFMYKIGSWKSFSKSTRFFLKLSTENSYNFGAQTAFTFFIPSGGFYNNGKSKSITYDLILTDRHDRSTLVYDFTKYKLAKSALQQLTDHGLITRDLIAEKLESNRNRRR